MTNNTTMAGIISTKEKGQRKHYCKKEHMLQKNESFIKKDFHKICESVLLMHVLSAALYFIPEEPPDKIYLSISFFHKKVDR